MRGERSIGSRVDASAPRKELSHFPPSRMSNIQPPATPSPRSRERQCFRAVVSGILSFFQRQRASFADDFLQRKPGTNRHQLAPEVAPVAMRHVGPGGFYGDGEGPYRSLN